MKGTFFLLGKSRLGSYRPHDQSRAELRTHIKQKKYIKQWIMANKTHLGPIKVLIKKNYKLTSKWCWKKETQQNTS